TWWAHISAARCCPHTYGISAMAGGRCVGFPGGAPPMSPPLGEVPVPDALDLPFDDDLGRSESLWYHGRTLHGWREMVGATGFEPATSCSRSRRATKLRYAPIPPAHAPSSGPAPTRPLALPGQASPPYLPTSFTKPPPPSVEVRMGPPPFPPTWTPCPCASPTGTTRRPPSTSCWKSGAGTVGAPAVTRIRSNGASS